MRSLMPCGRVGIAAGTSGKCSCVSGGASSRGSSPSNKASGVASGTDSGAASGATFGGSGTSSSAAASCGSAAGKSAASSFVVSGFTDSIFRSSISGCTSTAFAAAGESSSGATFSGVSFAASRKTGVVSSGTSACSAQVVAWLPHSRAVETDPKSELQLSAVEVGEPDAARLAPAHAASTPRQCDQTSIRRSSGTPRRTSAGRSRGSRRRGLVAQ
mmetsp:Transcript_62580/g.182985  ORF Transcript_62580/g.182985 Transcript_62580/m.182985 type:complete len:216 (-) Transcript_62580:240-887(-)